MNLRFLCLLSLLAACRGPPHFTMPTALVLHAPSKVKAVPGGTVTIDLSAEKASGPVTYSASAPQGFTATVDGARIKLDVPRGTPAGALTLTVTAKAGDDSAEASIEID